MFLGTTTVGEKPVWLHRLRSYVPGKMLPLVPLPLQGSDRARRPKPLETLLRYPSKKAFLNDHIPYQQVAKKGSVS